jgi:hypothetical protein
VLRPTTLPTDDGEAERDRDRERLLYLRLVDKSDGVKLLLPLPRDDWPLFILPLSLLPRPWLLVTEGDRDLEFRTKKAGRVSAAALKSLLLDAAFSKICIDLSSAN